MNAVPAVHAHRCIVSPGPARTRVILYRMCARGLRSRSVGRITAVSISLMSVNHGGYGMAALSAARTVLPLDLELLSLPPAIAASTNGLTSKALGLFAFWPIEGSRPGRNSTAIPRCTLQGAALESLITSAIRKW